MVLLNLRLNHYVAYVFLRLLGCTLLQSEVQNGTCSSCSSNCCFETSLSSSLHADRGYHNWEKCHVHNAYIKSINWFEWPFEYLLCIHMRFIFVCVWILRVHRNHNSIYFNINNSLCTRYTRVQENHNITKKGILFLSTLKSQQFKQKKMPLPNRFMFQMLLSNRPLVELNNKK